MATVYVPSGIAHETWNENGAGHKQHVTKYVFFFTIAQPEFFKTARSVRYLLLEPKTVGLREIIIILSRHLNTGKFRQWKEIETS
ncbi:hypothetical protein ABFA07_020058 [Porites harrisoni]